MNVGSCHRRLGLARPAYLVLVCLQNECTVNLVCLSVSMSVLVSCPVSDPVSFSAPGRSLT